MGRQRPAILKPRREGGARLRRPLRRRPTRAAEAPTNEWRGNTMSEKVTQPRKRPTAKVAASAAVGAVVTILVWVAGLLGLDVPAEIAAALTLLLMFGSSYVVKDHA